METFFLLVCPFSDRLSRQNETEFLREMRSSHHGNATYSRYIRRNFLYTCGKIGLTLCRLLSPLFDAPNEVGKLQQIHYTKGGATGGKDPTSIRRRKAGPSSREYPHVISSLVEADPIF